MKLKYLVIHCAWTPATMDVRGKDIRNWHTSPKSKGGRGWKQVGYSDLIWRDGTIENLVSYDSDNWVQKNEMTNGAIGFNSVSRHICLAGGMEKRKGNHTSENNFTPAQFNALSDYIFAFIERHPDIIIAGHYQIQDKGRIGCPSFNVPTFLKKINVPEKNIMLGDKYGSYR